MVKKWSTKKMLFLAVLMGVVLLAACGDEESSSSGDKELVVVNWKDYGSDNPDVVKEFEELCDCKVVHQYMASEEELLTKLRTSNDEIDVVLPNASILPNAINDGLLEEINTDELENYQYIDSKFTSLPENSKDGATYAIPWVWGSTAIGYNSELVDEEIDSINVFWDEKYKGKIAIRDDFNDAVMTAAIALGQDPSDPSDLEAIKQKLIEQKPLNRTYWKTGDQFTKLFANEQIAVGMLWSGQAAAMMQNGEPVKYVIPKEGAIGWVDNWAIVKDTDQKDLAMQFIDYMISKEFQYNWASEGGPAPVNNEAINDMDPQYVKDMGLDKETLEKLHFITFHTDEEKTEWNELWQEVKAQ